MNETRKTVPGARSLSVVYPVRDRASRIGEDLEAVCRSLDDRPPDDWELLVVDDASADATQEQVLEHSKSHPQVLLVLNPRPLGVGNATRHGVLISRGERILVAADPPEPWSALPHMEERLTEGFDLVVAAHRSGDDRLLPPVRIGRELLRSILSRPAKSGGGAHRPGGLRFHLYRRDAAMEIYGRQRLDGPSFAFEALYLARRYQYRVLEVGIAQDRSLAQRPSGRVRAGVGIGDLLRIRYNRLRGDYG